MEGVKLYKSNVNNTEGLPPGLNEALETLCACIVYGKVDKTSAFNNPVSAFESCLKLKDFILPADTLKKAIETFKNIKLDGPIIDVSESLKNEAKSKE